MRLPFPSGPALRQLDKRGKIAAHVGLFLRARPALDAPLCGDRLVDSLVVFGEHELHGPACVCVASRDQPLHVFAQSLLYRATRDSSVVTAVGASQDVNRSAAQRSHPGPNVVRNGTTLWPISIASRPPGAAALGVVLRDARFAGSSGRGIRARSLTSNLVLRSDAKHRVSKDDSSRRQLSCTPAGSRAGN